MSVRRTDSDLPSAASSVMLLPVSVESRPMTLRPEVVAKGRQASLLGVRESLTDVQDPDLLSVGADDADRRDANAVVDTNFLGRGDRAPPLVAWVFNVGVESGAGGG